MKKLLATLTIAITSLCSTAMAGTMTDNRDGHVYKTVQIGSQLWMAENMTFKSNGSYPPDGDYDNVSIYGRLYTWQAAKKVCPRGWHLPSESDFVRLLTTVKCRNSYGEMYDDCFTKLNNRGFSVLPAGERSKDGYFLLFGVEAEFWTSTPYGSSYAFQLGVKSSYAGVIGSYVSDALSVRCLKDKG